MCSDVFRLQQRFVGLGFKTEEAFVNVCLDVDPHLDFRDLVLFWNLGLVTEALSEKIELILEELKNE